MIEDLEGKNDTESRLERLIARIKVERLEPQVLHDEAKGVQRDLEREIFDLNLFLLEFTRDHPTFFHQGYVSIDENANVSLANWKWIDETQLLINKQLGVDTETFMKYNADEGTVKQGVPLYPDIYQRLQRLEQLRAELAGLRRAAQTASVAPPDPKPLQLVKKAFFHPDPSPGRKLRRAGHTVL